MDILINNAGIYGGYPQAALDSTIEQFKTAYDANVYGVVRVTQAFIDLLKKSSGPRIVNVSSSQGSITLHSDPSYKYYRLQRRCLSFFEISNEYVYSRFGIRTKGQQLQNKRCLPRHIQRRISMVIAGQEVLKLPESEL